jgi:N-acetyl-anhydromuramyl-L-alanine amidase AmpD
MRILPLTVAVLGCVMFAAGCQTQLVRDPPAPYFGPRVTSGMITPGAAPSSNAATLRDIATKPASTRWNTSEWRPDGPERAWRYIVIHHSATPTGSADEFDRMHRAKGWDELGYHFVIGNGTGSGNGAVEIGGRWTKQKHGAHAKIPGHPEYNDVGVGICLVGNFDVTRPTEAQMASLAKLVRFLMDRYGIPRARIFGHGQLKPTDCPGKNFDYDNLFRRL